LARRLLVAGAFVWVASRAVATGEAKPLPIEVPDDVPEAAVAPAPPRRAFRKRVATSLAFSVLFFAGAAFTAGAGNELASDGTSTDATPAVAAEATVPPPAPEVVTTDEAPVETAPAPAPAVEAAVPTPAPEVVTTVASPVETAPAPVPAVEATSPPPVPDIAATDAPPVDAAPASADPEPVRAVDAQDAVVLPATLAVSPAPVAASLAPVAHHPRSSVAPRHVRRVAIEFNPQAWLHNNPASPTGASVVAIAQHYLDVPYRWGGAVPATGFDCSGLTRFVYAQLGVNLPHYAASQFAAFPKLDPAQLQPGDLVFFEPKFDGPGHVALYIGNDQMIEAPHTGALVRVSSFSKAAALMGFLGAVRPYTSVDAPPTPLVTQVTALRVD
jgi:cell wall-associated NlpC family hydrolase